MSTPSVLALRPGAKLSKADRETLRSVGIVIVSVAPENLVAIQSVNVLPVNDMLRCALQTINGAEVGGYNPSDNRKQLRADFAKRVIETYLAYGESDAPTAKPSAVPSSSPPSVSPK